MDRISIAGGRHLKGTIPISGAKNAALPLIIASLLTSDRLTLKNVPNLADVTLLTRILRNHGLDLTIDHLRRDRLLLDALGPELAKAYLAVRQAEWNALKNLDLADEVNLLLERY